MGKQKHKTSPSKTFGLFINSLRIKHKLTLRELAEKSNTTVETIRNIEHGEAKMEEIGKLIPALSKALRANPRTLYELFWHIIFK